jgi:hypothetical protein
LNNELKILELANLKDGWNDHKSKKITGIAIATVYVFLANNLLWDPHISPTDDGGLQLEWNRPKSGLELHFGPDGSISGVLDIDNEITDHKLESWAEVHQLVGRFNVLQR